MNLHAAIKTWCSQIYIHGVPCGLVGRDATDQGLIPGSGTSPGEGTSYHASILAWRIPWTEEPGRLIQSIGLQRVGHG